MIKVNTFLVLGKDSGCLFSTTYFSDCFSCTAVSFRESREMCQNQMCLKPDLGEKVDRLGFVLFERE